MRGWVRVITILVALGAGVEASEAGGPPQGEPEGIRTESKEPVTEGRLLEGGAALEKKDELPGGPVDTGSQARGSRVGRSSSRSLAAQPVDKSVLWRLAGGMAVVVALSIGLVWVYRRWGGGGARLSTNGGLQVLGRTALSPKHFVYVLRLEDRRIVVGVSGDRMTTLAAYEEPPLRGTPFAKRPEPRAAEPRVEPPPRPSAITDEDFIPYRRQVSRLRDILRNHRGELSDGKDPL